MSHYAMPPVAQWLATPALTAVVGDRVYALRAPQDTQAPYITWLPVSVEEVPDIDSPQQTLAVTRLQIDVWAKSYQSASQIAGLVRAALAPHSVVLFAQAMSDVESDLARVIVEAEVVMH